MSSSPLALFLKSRTPQIALILMTMIWGGTFVIVHCALNYSSPMFFVGCRFAAATIAVGLLSYKYLKGINLKELIAGALIGGMIAAGYGSQTVGMQTISSSESAFLTALYVPLVPILIWVIFRKRPHIMIWLGIFLAFIGLIFLTGNGFDQIDLNTGQIVTLVGSFAIAMEIILIGYFAGSVNIQRVTVIQLAFASLISFASMPFVDELHISTLLVTIGDAFSWARLNQCSITIDNELGTTFCRSFSSCLDLCWRTSLGSFIWKNCR